MQFSRGADLQLVSVGSACVCVQGGRQAVAGEREREGVLSVLQAEPEPSLNWVPCILDKLQHGAWINPIRDVSKMKRYNRF